MDTNNYNADSTTGVFNTSPANDNDETPTVNSTNPNFHAVIDSVVQKGRTEFQKGQQSTETIVSKAKKLMQQH
ncbi:unnamed protein product, partial [Rotaria sp. Silwood1]